MKTLTVLFSVALYLAVIDLSCAEPENHDHDHDHHKQIRHRPKRQYQSDYIYQSHPAWYRPRYPEHRRDDQQDLLPHIYRLLEEISDLVRRPPPPPPPPQPIYVPYPVYTPAYPRRCKCPVNGTPNVTSRFPDMEDDNQNWGYDDSQEPEDEFDNSRPINFDPILPSSPTSRPPPNVEHGTNQASAGQERTISPTASRRPKRCDAIVLSCCDPKQSKQRQRSCFNSANCPYDKGDVCSPESIQQVLELFASTYAPSK